MPFSYPKFNNTVQYPCRALTPTVAFSNESTGSNLIANAARMRMGIGQVAITTRHCSATQQTQWMKKSMLFVMFL